MNHRYREEDVQEILSRAARIQEADPEAHDLERETLLRTAAELGIGEEALARAEAELVRELAGRQEEEAFRQLKRREFFEHLASYLGVNAFLVALNLLRFHGSFWAIWPILGWGLGLYLHAATSLSPRSATYHAEFEAFKKKRRATPTP